MKLGPVTKLDKRNKTTSKTFDDDVFSANCNIIVIFPDSWLIVCKTYIFIKSNLKYYKKKETELKSLYHHSHTIALGKATIFVKKC